MSPRIYVVLAAVGLYIKLIGAKASPMMLEIKTPHYPISNDCLAGTKNCSSFLRLTSF
jgi:hypothetical protein